MLKKMNTVLTYCVKKIIIYEFIKLNTSLRKEAGDLNVLFDYSKLKGRIVECYKNQSNFARVMRLSERTISLKLNNRVPFTDQDIAKWCSKLKIPLEKVDLYFFTPCVQKNEQSEVVIYDSD